MSALPDIAAAEARVKAARARLLGTLGEVQARLRPSNLAQDAIETATQTFATAARKGREAVRSRPLTVAAIAGGVGLVMARGWIADILHGRKPGRGDETDDSSKGLKHRHKPAKTAKGHSK